MPGCFVWWRSNTEPSIPYSGIPAEGFRGDLKFFVREIYGAGLQQKCSDPGWEAQFGVILASIPSSAAASARMLNKWASSALFDVIHFAA